MVAEKSFRCRSYAKSLLKLFTSAVCNPRNLRSKAFNVVLFLLQKTFRNKHRHIHVFVACFLKHSELDVNKELWTANRTLMGWEDKERKSNWSRKFIITWDNNGKKQLDAMVAKYPDQFLVIPYTKEKRMVDEWYESNETMVDPGFDIQLMDGSLDKRKVLLYAATNHLYDFRLFAKVLPDVVEKYITKDELRDFGA